MQTFYTYAVEDGEMTESYESTDLEDITQFAGEMAVELDNSEINEWAVFILKDGVKELFDCSDNYDLTN